MMQTNRFFPQSLAGLVLALTVWLTMAGAAHAADFKIGVVDMKQITERSAAIQTLIGNAEGPLLEQRQKIDQQRRDYEEQRRKLDERRSVLSPADAQKEEEALRNRQDAIKDLEYETSKQYARLEDEVMRPAIEKILSTIETVAKREGFDLILPSEMALYKSEKADITPMVIQELDRSAAPKK